MSKVLVIKGADFSANSFKKVNFTKPEDAVYMFGMSDAAYFNTKMNESPNLSTLAPNDALNSNVVGKTIFAIKVVSQGVGKSFRCAVFDYAEPVSTSTTTIDADLPELWSETFTTTKGQGEIEEFLLTNPVYIADVNKRFSIYQNNAVMCHMGEYADMVMYNKTSAGVPKLSRYNYMDKIMFDVKAA